MDDGNLSWEATVGASVRAAAAVRARLVFLAGLLSQDQFDDLRLVVTELVNEAVVDGGVRHGTPIRVSLTFTPAAVLIRVKDGRPRRIGLAADGDELVDADRGSRLALVRRITDRLYVDSSRGLAEAELRRS